MLLIFGIQTFGQINAAESKIDLTDIMGLLSKPPYWSLYESYIAGKKETNSNYRAYQYIFNPNGLYLEYSDNKLKEGIWSYDETQKTLFVEFFNSKDIFTIKYLNHVALIIEHQNGNSYSLSSGQGPANSRLQRRLDESLAIEDLKKEWENMREEETAREFTILECDDFSYGLAVIGTAKGERDKHYGYINEEGEFVVKPSFENAFGFTDGYGLVKTFSREGEYFFLNQKGDDAFGKKFQEARSFNEGMAAVRNKEWLWGFINTKGEYIVKPKYEKADDFNDGIARVMQGDKWGYIDTNGNEIVIPQFTCANNFSEGFALVGQFVHYHYTQYSFIDKSGKIAFKVNREETEVRISCCTSDINPRFNEQNNVERCMFKDGIVIITTGPPNESFLFNKEGKKNRASQDDIHSFNEGLAVAQKTVGQRYGFIDNKGSWQVDPIFDFASDFNEGLAAVSINDNWGFIDKSGKIIINKNIVNTKTVIQTNPPFESVSDFSEGLAVVVVRGKYGYINREGQWIIKPELINAAPFKNGKASVLLEEKKGWNFIDKTGKVLFPKFR